MALVEERSPGQTETARDTTRVSHGTQLDGERFCTSPDGPVGEHCIAIDERCIGDGHLKPEAAREATPAPVRGEDRERRDGAVRLVEVEQDIGICKMGLQDPRSLRRPVDAEAAVQVHSPGERPTSDGERIRVTHCEHHGMGTRRPLSRRPRPQAVDDQGPCWLIAMQGPDDRNRVTARTLPMEHTGCALLPGHGTAVARHPADGPASGQESKRERPRKPIGRSVRPARQRSAAA